jgi:hypothetical protein
VLAGCAGWLCWLAVLPGWVADCAVLACCAVLAGCAVLATWLLWLAVMCCAGWLFWLCCADCAGWLAVLALLAGWLCWLAGSLAALAGSAG